VHAAEMLHRCFIKAALRVIKQATLHCSRGTWVSSRSKELPGAPNTRAAESLQFAL